MLEYFAHYAAWPVNDILLSTVQEIFSDRFCLSNWNASGAPPCSAYESRIHIDSRIPISDPSNSTHIVAMVALSPFNEFNGATKFFKKSHLSGKRPHDCAQEFQIEQPCMSPGEVTLFLGQTFHDISKNSTNSYRWGIIGYYTLWWVKPTYDFTVINPKSLSEEEMMIYGHRAVPPHPFDLNKYTVR